MLQYVHHGVCRPSCCTCGTRCASHAYTIIVCECNRHRPADHIRTTQTYVRVYNTRGVQTPLYIFRARVQPGADPHSVGIVPSEPPALTPAQIQDPYNTELEM